MAEPTSTLTFENLILEVAEKLGVAYYGATGTAAASIPVDTQDLNLCKRLANNAVRMFIHDAPLNGWRWSRPVASVSLWADIDQDSANTISTATYNTSASNTTVVVPTAAFFPTMERKTFTLQTIGDRTIEQYVSATSVVVSGSNSGFVGKMWSIASEGSFTLPQSFGGQFIGQITYAADTNRSINTEWCDESTIRQWRADVTEETGTPHLFAVRVMDNGSPRRRWELLTYTQPDEDLTVEFPYVLHFDSLVNLTDVHPAPFGHDETIKAACKAVIEKEVEHVLGVEWGYYKESALPASHRVDAMSAPKKLQPRNGGASSIRDFRDNRYQRPTVTFNP